MGWAGILAVIILSKTTQKHHKNGGRHFGGKKIKIYVGASAKIFFIKSFIIGLI